MPLDPLQTMQKIEKSLLETNKPVSISRLARKTGLHYTTVRRYVTLLESVKKMPEIEIIKGEGTTLVRTEKDFSMLTTEKRKEVIKSYFPKLSEEERILIKLLDKKAVSKISGVEIKKGKIVKLLLKAGIIEETDDGRVYLSDTGCKMAKGAKDIYKK